MVPDGQTLTIESGVEVIFQDPFKLNVQGSVLANGTASDTITAADTTNGWHRICFDNTPATNDSSKFFYCKVQYSRATGTSPDNRGGAFYFENFSKAIISNCRISNNSANNDGGGIYCYYDSNPTITNNNISNNSASKGGGICCIDNSNPTFKNTILWGNTSSTSGAQVYLNDENSDPDFYYCDVQGGTAAFGLNGVSYTGNYENNIDTDPLFMSPSAGSGTGYNGLTADWSLQSGSPCIDTGTPDTTGLNLPATDIAGNPRIINERVDIGAYEYQGPGFINEAQNTFSMNIYPKPATNHIHIECQTGGVVSVYNLQRKNIFTCHLEHQRIINTSNWPRGMYIVTYYSDNGSLSSQKLILQ